MSKYIDLIYKNLERLIEEKKSSGRKVSDIVGMSSSWVSDLKNAKSIKFELLEKICEYYNVPISYFFTEDLSEEISRDMDKREKILKELSFEKYKSEALAESMPPYVRKSDDEIANLIESNKELTRAVKLLEKKLQAFLTKESYPPKTTKYK